MVDPAAAQRVVCVNGVQTVQDGAEKIKGVRVKVSLVLNRLGHVVSLAIAESSGDPLFDEAALDMVRRSDPVPRPPAALTEDTFSYNLPVDFRDKK